MLISNISPKSVFFLILYLFFLSLTLTNTTFYSFWIFMEISSLLLLSFTLFSVTSFSYSSIMVFYLIQSCSSLGLLISYLYSSSSTLIPSLLFLSFLSIKMGLFPFNFWYFYSVFNFPSLPLFITLTFHKLFSIFILSYFLDFNTLTPYLLPILLLTLLTSSTLVSQSPSLLSLLIISSLFNNIWIVLSSSVDFSFFLIYFLLYSFLSFFLIFYSTSSYSSLLFFTLMGFPPFPLFFFKILILYFLLITSFPISLIFFLILTNVALISLYYNISSFSLKSMYSSSLYIK